MCLDVRQPLPDSVFEILRVQRSERFQFTTMHLSCYQYNLRELIVNRPTGAPFRLTVALFRLQTDCFQAKDSLYFWLAVNSTRISLKSVNGALVSNVFNSSPKIIANGNTIYFELFLQYKPKNGFTLPPEKEMVFVAKSFLLPSYKRLKFACLFIGNHFLRSFVSPAILNPRLAQRPSRSLVPGTFRSRIVDTAQRLNLCLNYK